MQSCCTDWCLKWDHGLQMRPAPLSSQRHAAIFWIHSCAWGTHGDFCWSLQAAQVGWAGVVGSYCLPVRQHEAADKQYLILEEAVAAGSELQLDFCLLIPVTSRDLRSQLALNSARASAAPDAVPWLFLHTVFQFLMGLIPPYFLLCSHSAVGLNNFSDTN